TLRVSGTKFLRVSLSVTCHRAASTPGDISMKMLTTLTAVAALLAGISVASAQMTREPDNNRASSPQYNSQAADPTNNTRSSGAMPAPGSQQQAIGNSPFCVTT